MTSDMAENQATRMVTVIQTLTAGLLTLAMALALVFAADRAREQDETPRVPGAGFALSGTRGCG